MNKDKIPEEIFELLASKDYSNLSNHERTLVNKFMTPNEFDTLHDTIYAFSMADDALDIQVPQLLFPKNDSSYLSKILNYPIPTYLVAAGILVLLGLFFVLQSSPSSESDLKDSLEVIQNGTSIANDNYPEDLVFEL